MRGRHARFSTHRAKGATLTEYAIIMAFMSLVVLISTLTLGGEVRSAFIAPASELKAGMETVREANLTSEQRAQEAKDEEEKGPAMILVIDTGLTGNTTGHQFTLALGGTVDVEVDWGEGAPASCPTVILSAGFHPCEYGRAGVFTIQVRGHADMFGHATAVTPNISRLLEVRSWGQLGIRRLDRAFQQASNLRSVPSHAPIGLVSLNSTFQQTNRFNDPDLSGWDVSQVTDMTALFSSSAFNQSLAGWDVGNVRNFHGVFQYSPFNHPIGNWDVSSGTNFARMFRGNMAFDQDLSDWEMTSAVSANLMFATGVFNQDIGGWDVRTITDMGHMFAGATRFNQDLSRWCVAHLPTKPGSFDGGNLNGNNGVWRLPQPRWGQACVN